MQATFGRGRALSAAWIGLAGALIGAAASIITTWMVLRRDRKRWVEQWEREERTRFHRDRVRYYSEFEGAVLQVKQALLRMTSDGPEDLDFDRLRSLFDRVIQKSTWVTAVATQPVAIPTAQIIQHFRNGLQIDHDEPNRSLTDFKVAARLELGVDPIEVPPL